MKPVESVAVIGAGLMGHALALVHAAGGCTVRLYDNNPDQVSRGLALVESALATLIDGDALGEEDRSRIRERISAAPSLADAVAGADLVVEAVVEVPDVKRTVFAEVDERAPSDAIVASNTSHLDVFPLIPPSRRRRALIAHWYTPPYIIDLVDLAAGPETDPAVLRHMHDLYRAMGKKPVLFERFIAGYVANRLQAAMGLEITRLLDEGWAGARAIDDSIKYGLALRMALMGALMKADFTGLQLMHRGTANRSYQPPVPTGRNATLDALIEQGRHGVLAGAGYFEYGDMTPEELFRNRDRGLLQLKAQVARIERDHPLGTPPEGQAADSEN